MAATRETPLLIRCIATVCLVALISSFISRFEQVQGQFDFVGGRYDSSTWVRTVDGWESPEGLRTTPRIDTEPSLHPLLVASFQGFASLLALAALPAAGSKRKSTGEASVRGSVFALWRLQVQKS